MGAYAKEGRRWKHPNRNHVCLVSTDAFLQSVAATCTLVDSDMEYPRTMAVGEFVGSLLAGHVTNYHTHCSSRLVCSVYAWVKLFVSYAWTRNSTLLWINTQAFTWYCIFAATSINDLNAGRFEDRIRILKSSVNLNFKIFGFELWNKLRSQRRYFYEIHLKIWISRWSKPQVLLT